MAQCRRGGNSGSSPPGKRRLCLSMFKHGVTIRLLPVLCTCVSFNPVKEQEKGSRWGNLIDAPPLGAQLKAHFLSSFKTMVPMQAQGKGSRWGSLFRRTTLGSMPDLSGVESDTTTTPTALDISGCLLLQPLIDTMFIRQIVRRFWAGWKRDEEYDTCLWDGRERGGSKSMRCRVGQSCDCTGTNRLVRKYVKPVCQAVGGGGGGGRSLCSHQWGGPSD